MGDQQRRHSSVLSSGSYRPQGTASQIPAIPLSRSARPTISTLVQGKEPIKQEQQFQSYDTGRFKEIEKVLLSSRNFNKAVTDAEVCYF